MERAFLGAPASAVSAPGSGDCERGGQEGSYPGDAFEYLASLGVGGGFLVHIRSIYTSKIKVKQKMRLGEEFFSGTQWNSGQQRDFYAKNLPFFIAGSGRAVESVPLHRIYRSQLCLYRVGAG